VYLVTFVVAVVVTTVIVINQAHASYVSILFAVFHADKLVKTMTNVTHQLLDVVFVKAVFVLLVSHVEVFVSMIEIVHLLQSMDVECV